MKSTSFPVLTLALGLAFSGQSLAAPGILNHQGRIAVSGVNFNGTGHFKFALVDTTASTSFWSNDDTSTAGSEPTAGITVPVVNGHYAVALGESNAIPASIFVDNDDVRLRIWFSETGTGGSFELLSPDRRITSAGYALSSAALATDATLPLSLMDATGAAGALGQVLAIGGSGIEWRGGSTLDNPDGTIADVVRIDADGRVGIGADGPDPLASAALFLEPRGNAPGLSDPRSVAVQGDFAYVVDAGTNLLQVFDVSDPDNIVPRDSDGTNMNVPTSIAVQGNFAYVVDSLTDLLQVFDISDPDNIVPRDSDGTNISFPRSVAVQGNFAYVVDSITQLLQVFDISDPDNIVPRDSDG
ncbi:MAG: hypothetical protein AAGA58_14700, partial [Verrucomicrobiota bacterium]